MTPPANVSPNSDRGLLIWTLVALAAGLALAALGLGFEMKRLRTENAALATDRDLAEVAVKTAQTQLKERSFVAENLINELGRQLREKEDLSRLKIVPLTSTAASGTAEYTAVALWDPAAQNGLLLAVYLPANSEDDDYALWIDDPSAHHAMVAIVFHVSDRVITVRRFNPRQPVVGAASFRISLQKKSGDPAVEGPTMLAGRP